MWQTVAGAERFIAVNGLTATHSVYGLDADWDAGHRGGRRPALSASLARRGGPPPSTVLTWSTKIDIETRRA